MKTNRYIYAKSDGVLLKDHLNQVAIVAERIAHKLGYNPKLLKNGAILHDIGKTHPKFQEALFSKSKPTEEKVFRHEIASILFLPLFPKEEWNQLIEMVIAHHKSPETSEKKGNGIIDLIEIEGEEEIFDFHTSQWDDWSKDALQILDSFGITSKYLSLDDAQEAFDYCIDYCENLGSGWSEYKGILNIADHIASSIYDATETISEQLFNIPNLEQYNALERKSELFPLSLISVESKCPHSLVIAPTGAGKTDYLFRRCNGRVFYTLPFQASINAMYHRVRDFLPDDTDIRLQHSTSRLQIDDKNNFEEKVMQSKAGAAIKILTPHQLAALICGTKGFEAIALDIRECDVILDEIHCYSDVSQAMVIEIVKVLVRLGCRIHLGSATMPTVLTDMLLDILGRDNVLITKLDDNELDKFDRHRIIKCDTADLPINTVSEYIEQNQKVLVVCNKVDTAQARYDSLKETFPNIPILLLHSRFKRADRAQKEFELINTYNNREVNPDACIVVSTQVVEVSLDISFDVMFTDAAPIDAMIQRFGRINRKRTKETVAKKIIKDIHILAPPDSQRDVLPYKKEIVDASFEQFENGEIVKEKLIQNKIDNVYPKIDMASIKTKIVWDGDRFLLKKLNHYPKAVLMETLNIESATAIVYQDAETYNKSKGDDRIPLEIPIPRSTRFKKFTNFGYSSEGARPVIVHDDLYSYERGLIFEEIDNFL